MATAPYSPSPRPILVFSDHDVPQGRFDRTFTIGRHDSTDVVLKNDYVSRVHVRVSLDDGQWWITDLNSSNGVFVEGVQKSRVPVGDGLEIRLGVEGPFVRFAVPPIAQPTIASPTGFSSKGSPEADVEEVISRYFKKGGTAPVSEHTMLVRQAFQQVHKRHTRSYRWIVGGMALIAILAAGYAWRLRQATREQINVAKELFYSIKSLDVDIAGLEKLVQDSENQSGNAQLAKYKLRRVDMEKNYNRFLDTLHVYDAKMTPQHRLVMRIARIFGESELDMPPEFVSEVDAYIDKWRGSDRLAMALQNAQKNNAIPFIVNELLSVGLPPQFLYLALQESNFDPYISGPPTRSGIAKGMWQFVPETALKYGLKLGPLVDLPRPDPADDRHNWELETKAAARYLKDLYLTEAEASGFLVMSCYNWGEDRVLPMVRKMPPNPKDRNFWKLLAMGKDKIPHETYDYVFYIASAAVIGENPRLFGFDFDNPLGYLEKQEEGGAMPRAEASPQPVLFP